MPRLIRISTPENVTIEYELAGPASRAGAVIIDTLIQSACIGGIALLRLLLSAFDRWPGTSLAGALLALAAFTVFWGYFVFFETVWNGQTPGKRALSLRTVREQGTPVDLTCAALRNLIRIIDFLPPPYIIGAVCVLVTARSQRLGDIAAGTVVVKERAGIDSFWAGLSRDTFNGPVERFRTKNIELVTRDEFEAAKRFCQRRHELNENLREQLAERIARPIMDRLGIEDTGPGSYSDLLCELYARCVQERGMR